MKIIMISLITLFVYCAAFAENTNEWVVFRDKLAQLQEEYIYMNRIRNAGGVVDNMKGLIDQKLSFIELRNMMKGSWPVALEHLEQIATNDVQKMVILLSSWELPEDEFTEFLTQVADMVEAGKLDWQLLKWTSSPFNSGRENYDLKNDKHIKAIIQRVRELKPSAAP